MEQGTPNQGKEISITLNREKLINGVLALQLGLLLVFGWQIWGIKQVVNGDAPEAKAQNQPAPAPSAAAPTAAAPAGEVPAPDDSDHVRGSSSAKITLIEYSDFDCPFCARFHPTAKQAVDEYGNEVNWVYRHFPLSIHPAAQKKAEASECVAELGGNDAFWKFTDQLFADQSVAVTALSPLASAVGVNAGAFQDCLDSGKYAATVSAQMNSGASAGVTGTPGTFVHNNETGESSLVPGAVPYSQLKATIDSLL